MRRVRIDEISPHPLNKEIYSTTDQDDLKQSILQLGLLQPIIVNQNNLILSGHRRYECIKDLGWEFVDVEIKYVDEKETELYLVHFNKQRVKTIKEIIREYCVIEKHYENKRGKIKNVLTNNYEEKYNRRDIISQEIGIKSSQLGKILFINKNKEDYIDLIDKGILTINQAYLQTQRIIKEENIKIIDVPLNPLIINNWRIYFKSSDNMIELEDGEVQTIFTSPPYWNKRTYLEGGGLGNEDTPELYVKNLSNHLKDCYRVLNKNGSFFLNLGDTFLKGDLQNIPHQVILKLKEQGWILRNTIIWSKTNPKPSSTKNNLTPSYEFIFHLVKNMNYYYNLTLTPLSNKTNPSLPPRHRNLNKSYSVKQSPYIPNSNGKNMGDFWNEDIIRTSVANQKLGFQREHPAPFPEQLVYLPILQTTREHDLVCDLFCGIGSVGNVCDVLNRKFCGYDIKNYISQTKKLSSGK
jgi:DNA modification methylase